MISKILAIVAAAVCAGAIVEFAPEPAPAVAAGAAAATPTDASIADSDKPATIAAMRIAESRKAVCSQAWPYYEPVCLHDNRQSDGKARAVRLIIANGSVGRISQAPH